MTIYQHRQTLATAAGSVNSVTLRIPGGMLNHAIVKANTSANATFRVALTDTAGLSVQDWGFVRGELNDATLNIPMNGQYTLAVTNASPDDTFSIYLAVRENG